MGLVSNGLRLRVLRDNASLTRQAFLEFDLEAMFEGEVYSDFALLWLVCHQSRFETVGADGVRPDCILEQWSKTAQEQGTRALEQLRKGVEQAIAALGSGFLRAPAKANAKLLADLRSGALSTQDYYRQLLRLVYRLIFLFVAEDRDLLFDPQSSPEARGRYLRHYALGRLRRLAERSRGGRHPDLYAALRLVTDILGGRKESGAGKTGLGLSVLGGFLFAGEALPDLESAELENESLLSAIRHLTLMEDGRIRSARRAVDYKNLGARELGSVYESLLELHPLINTDAATFELSAVAGSERKTTGSFYTPEELIAVLLDSALNPVIEQALARAAGGLEGQIAALHTLKICDPACGSGHFLLAAARRLARRLAQLRTGEGEPPPEALRAALREVISQCIYGVDLNPMSVELCKVSLWMEALEPGKPLSFLDAHIQCGDSLVGVAPGLEMAEIPDEAFNPAFGDDKATASALKKRNKAERGGQMGLDVFVIRDQEDLAAWMARQAQEMDALPEETAEQVGQKAQTYREYLDSPQYRRRKQEYDLWTAAFFWKMEAQPGSAGILAPTQEMLRRQRSGAYSALPPELVRRVEELARRLNFLHWELAFPKVFAGDNPGFDCVLGNPPWERIKLQEEEFFAVREPEIAAAANKAARQKMINALIHSNPALATAFEDAKHAAECSSKFVRQSVRYPLTAFGDVNTYALFAELACKLITPVGRVGIIVPTGVVTDDTTKNFFRDIVERKSLVSFLAFKNEEFIFAYPVEHTVTFGLLTMLGAQLTSEKMEFTWLAYNLKHMNDKRRRLIMRAEDFALFNPNTRTCPIFRTGIDVELTRKIYRQVPILEDESSQTNFWGISFFRMVDIANDSFNFVNEEISTSLPLYEAKLLHQFDHRWATYKGLSVDEIQKGLPREFSLDEKLDTTTSITPRYWLPQNLIIERIKDKTHHKWLLAYRRIARSTDIRTFISGILPLSGVADKLPLILTSQPDALVACLLANINSLIFDYVTRQKIGGTQLDYHYVKQLPVLPPSAYTPADIAYIAPRVLELVYTAYDLRPFAEDMGYHNEPFRWDEVRRAQLRAELDAYYARLYGLTRDELRYILDPKEVHGEDFPGETFRVLKEKEIRLYGEYRTRRLVLEAWDNLAGVEVSSYQAPADDGRRTMDDGKPAVVSGSSSTVSPAPVKEVKPAEENPAQPSFSDFGLYECLTCGKRLMGFDQRKHESDVHAGKGVEWKNIR